MSVKPNIGSDGKPTVGVATRWFGVRSQVWMWRQIRMFETFAPRVLSWTYENRTDFPLDGVPIDLIGTEEEPNGGKRRWLWRAANLPSGNLYGTRGQERRRIRTLLDQNPPDVLLCHFGHVGLRFLPIARERNIPIVVHFHGDDISSALNDRYYRWSLRRSIGRFDAIVCVGTEQRAKLLTLGADESRVFLIPCGVPTDEFVPAGDENGRPPTFVCVSRLVPQKGVHYSLAAFARVVRDHPSARLLIAGDGKEEPNLRSDAERLGIASSVEFLGSCSAGEIRALLRRADVFLQHSLTHKSGWFEGFGVSIAEASATGLPVVVSRCGGIADQVVDGVTGFIVPQRDDAAMADAMLRLASNRQLRATMGAAGRSRMIECFDTKKQVAALEKVMTRALHRERQER